MIWSFNAYAEQQILPDKVPIKLPVLQRRAH